jgi:8-oxo-dGDP phosphatase
MAAVEMIDSRQVYASRWLSVREDEVRYQDGTTGGYAVVEGPDIALTIPADGERLHLVEQYRYPVGGRRWEFPCGSQDERFDVEPAGLAARELAEETGLVAADLSLLGTLEITPSTFTQRCWVFLATDLTEGTPRREVEEQDMRSAWFTRAEVEQMVTGGVITDAKSLAAYSLLLLHAGTDGR